MGKKDLKQRKPKYCMPLKATQSKRRLPKMPYFKGTLREAKRTPLNAVFKNLKSKGLTLKDAQEIIQKAREAIKQLQPGERESVVKAHTSKGVIILKIVKTPRGVVVHEQPVTHGITKPTSYSDLVAILQTGFKPSGQQNTFNQARTDQNVIFGTIRNQTSSWAKENAESGITQNDKYTLQLMTPLKEQSGRGEQERYGLVEQALASEILCVNIQLPYGLTKEQRKSKMEYYKTNIQKKYGIPVKFVE
jgi:hypothetical protein